TRGGDTSGPARLRWGPNPKHEEPTMSLSLSIDLSDATFADLRALVDAARTAGVSDDVRLELEDTTLLVTATDTAARDGSGDAPAGAATPRTEQPRGPFGSGNWRGQG